MGHTVEKVFNRNDEEVFIEVFTKEDKYRVFANEVWVFDCALNKVLLGELVKAYKRLVTTGKK